MTENINDYYFENKYTGIIIPLNSKDCSISLCHITENYVLKKYQLTREDLGV